MIVDTGDGAWVYLLRDGKVVRQRPWCDCSRKRQIAVLGARQAMMVGYTQREDGAWVRPCCMRRDRQAWEVHGDSPVEHSPLTCSVCQEQVRTNRPAQASETLKQG